MPLDGQVPAIDGTTQRGRGPERRAAQHLVRLAQLRDPAGLFQREGRVVVGAVGQPGVSPEVEGQPRVEKVGRHGGIMPENVAGESTAEVDG